MNRVKQKRKYLLVFFLGLGLFMGFNGVSAKADVVIDEENPLILKSTEFKSKSVIKVPDREEEERKQEAERLKQEAESRNSRGQAVVNDYENQELVAGSGQSVVDYAMNFLGRPYVWGAEGPNAFDCSGFTLYVYSAFGVYLPHYTGSQVQQGVSVSRSNLQSGDLVFFNTYENFGHVGIYIGGGRFIHAATGSAKITISSLTGYYDERYAGARRILN